MKVRARTSASRSLPDPIRAVFYSSDQHPELAFANAEAARVEDLPGDNGSRPAIVEASGIAAPATVPGHDDPHDFVVLGSRQELSAGSKWSRVPRVYSAVAAVLLVFLVASGSIWYVRRDGQKEFNLFWAPTFEQARPPMWATA